MSSSKKRSGFQITSVTSDLLHLTSTTGRLSPSVVRTVQSDASSFGRPQGSSSQPSTPSLKRKHISHGALGQRAGCSSRFRVVRLAGGRSGARGRNELYRRGRWTCMEFMEQQEGVGYRRVMDSMRHAHSLESLEMIGRDTERGVVYSEDTAHLLAQPLRVSEGAGLVLHSGPLSPVHQEPISIQHLDKSWPGAGLVVQSGPPSPVHQEPISIQHLDRTEPITEQGLNSTPPPASPRPQSFPRPLRQLDADATRRSVLRASQSLPSSPPSYRPTLTSVRTPSAFSLDQTIFNLSGDSSASSNSLQAIDNKIERAMDLVKSHLMLAVREEVEIMREQIRELQEKNQQLERENHILRTLTHNYTTT